MASRANLAKIHLGIKQLGWDDGTHRMALHAVCGVASSKDLDDAGATRYLKHLESKGAKFNLRKAPIRIDASRAGLLKVVGAILTEQKKPWAYAHAIAKHNFGKDRVEWLPEAQMRGLIAQLRKQA